MKHLGLNVDNKLSLEQHINHIFKSAVNQLNAPIRLTSFLGFQERIVLVNSFVLSNFIHRTLVWMFASSKSLAKIENLHKRTPRFMLDYYSSSYELYICIYIKYIHKYIFVYSLCVDNSFSGE